LLGPFEAGKGKLRDFFKATGVRKNQTFGGNCLSDMFGQQGRQKCKIGGAAGEGRKGAGVSISALKKKGGGGEKKNGNGYTRQTTMVLSQTSGKGTEESKRVQSGDLFTRGVESTRGRAKWEETRSARLEKRK